MKYTRIEETPKRKNFIDRSGEVHGFWEIQSFSHVVLNNESRKRSYYWNCKCLGCGKVEKPIAWNNLTSGQTTSCGCQVRRTDLQIKGDFTGKRIGFLEVIRKNEDLSREKKISMYECVCHNCGSTCNATAYTIKAEKIFTCGSRQCITDHLNKTRSSNRAKATGTEVALSTKS